MLNRKTIKKSRLKGVGKGSNQIWKKGKYAHLAIFENVSYKKILELKDLPIISKG
jgi:hypothetical protein